MSGKIFVWLLITVLLTTAPSVEAQQQTKNVPRIGFLTGVDRAIGSSRFEAFRLALRALGYIEGQNVTFEYRNSERNNDRLPELAAELVRLNVDMIVISGGLPVVRAAKNATKTIPIVMAGRGMDPVVSGVVESLARPGGNVTGITNLSRELGGKRLELLKEAAPKSVNVAVLYESGNPGSLRELKEILPVAARALKLTIRPWEVRDADGFEKVFNAINKERPDGMYATSSPLMTAHQKQTITFTSKRRLPAIGGITEFVENGGLMSYDGDATDGYGRVAIYVDKILKGAKPADLPVQQPTKFELAINLKTAKQIGLTIPQSMLYRADRVIK